MQARLVPGTQSGLWWSIGYLVAAFALATICLLAAGCGPDLMAQATDLESQGDLSGAVEVYQRALEADPENLRALSGAALDLAMLGRYDEALVFQERIVNIDPKDVQTRVELGFNYLNHQGRVDDAVRVLAEAVELDPSAKHLAFLAQAQIASSDYTGAEQSLRHAIETDPTYGHSYNILIRLLNEQNRTEDAGRVSEQAASHGVAVSE